VLVGTTHQFMSLIFGRNIMLQRFLKKLCGVTCAAQTTCGRIPPPGGAWLNRRLRALCVPAGAAAAWERWTRHRARRQSLSLGVASTEGRAAVSTALRGLQTTGGHVVSPCRSAWGVAVVTGTSAAPRLLWRRAGRFHRVAAGRVHRRRGAAVRPLALPERVPPGAARRRARRAGARGRAPRLYPAALPAARPREQPPARAGRV
jgi:hypothetical protein